MNKKHMTRLLLVSTIAVVLIIALLPKSRTYAEETKLGEVELSSILYDRGSEVISSIPAQSFGEYDIGSGFSNVLRVELRDKNGNVVKNVPHTSGTKYDIGTINYNSTVRVVTPSDEPAEIDEGYFEWFRDPNKVVWMYDLDGSRTYRDTRPTIYERPPSDAKEATSVYDQNGTQLTGDGAVAWAKREGIIPNVPTMQIDGTTDVVPFNAVSGLTFSSSDFQVNLDGDRKLSTSDVLDIETQALDPTTLYYKFLFQANYDFEPDEEISDDYYDPNGRVIRYYNAWKIGIEGYVYKYPKLFLWVVQGVTPPPSSPPPSQSPTPTPDSGPEVVTGDFTIDKPVINFGENNGVKPVNVKVSGGNGSKLVEFGFTFTQGSLSDSSYGPATFPSAVGFNGPPYPAGMGGGTVNVTMKIKTSLGTVKTVGPKSFQIVLPPNNNPPVFEPGWFLGGNSGAYPPIRQALLGDYVDLGIVHDPTQTPNTPYDPEGDNIMYTWDFAGSSDPWIQAIGDRPSSWIHDEHFGLIRADVLGTHTVQVSAMDLRGASAGTRTVTIEVMDPNAPPIPIITLPPKVVEGRSFTPDISGANSYSPIESRTIRDYIWTGKQAMYPTAGTYPITLSVVDSAGIQSEYPAVKDLVVQPDLPPIPRMDNPGIGIRNSPIYFKDTSYSPDADPIATHTTELAYDSNNNGSFADESYSPVTMDSNGNFSYTASKVGKYDIRIYVKEGLGYQRDATGHFGFEVVNDAPEADYYVEGSDFAPPLVETTSFSASTLLNDANWNASTPSTGTVAKNYLFNSGENALETPKGRSVPYKSITSSNLTATTKQWFGTDDNYNSDSVLRSMITPDLFHNGGTTFTNVNFAYPGSFVPSPLIVSGSEFYVKEIDVENDRIWFNSTYLSTGANNYYDDVFYTDYVYRISDISRQVLYGWATYQAQPLYTRSLRFDDYTTPNPPLPSNVWTNVPEKKVNGSQGVPYQFNDKMISFSAVREPKTSQMYQPFGQYINLFDLRTNTTNSVKLYSYSVRDRNEDGNVSPGPDPAFLITADEKITVYGNQYLRVVDLQGNIVASMDGLNSGTAGSYLFYNGDGSLVISTGTEYSDNDTNNYLYIIKSNPDTSAKINSFGQLSNPTVSLADGDVTAQIKLNYDNFTNEPSTGISVRMQNNQNMYRLEVTAKKTRIVKIVNGVKTVLSEANYPLQFRQWYNLKLKVKGSNLKGYIGGVPVVEANDGTFSSGLAGPYSEVEYSLLKGFSVTKYLSNGGVTRNTAIVGTPLNYIKSYSDTENDPAIDPSTRWMYTHTNSNKFLNAGDGYSGVSAYNGQTVTAPNPVLDKVGEYKVDYQVPDDPAPVGYTYPNNTFAGYRKYSDIASHNIIIHRRPLAVFSLFLNGDNTVGWNDTSYDPDRWLSSWNYSTEPTGINYQATRGIVERKMNFTTPSGETRSGQLIRPGESGTYTVRLAVKDEYGAWSDWVETTINISVPFPNNKPSAALTFPNGSYWNPSYVSLRPTLTWNQSDPDPGTIFTQFEVLVRDEYGNTYESKTSNYYTSNPSWSWTLNNTLDPGKKYWAQVRVWDDSGLASDWTNIGWMMTNAAPTASMAYPNGTQANPTIVTSIRPTFTWNQTDPDPGNIFTQAEIEVTNEANTVTIYDKVFGQWTSQTWNSFQADQNLPAGQKLRVRVRVWDNYGVASNWSAQTWFMINRPPVADFDWSPKPVWEGDTVQLTNLSTDPDGDSLSFLWEVTGLDGQSASYGTTNVSQKFLLAGAYTVKLTVSDGYVSSQVIKVITAQPLIIQSDVEHTPEWLAHHQKLQHNTTERPIDFYSGEIFVVHTRSSPAPVSRAEAWMDTTGLDGNELKINTILAQSVDDNTLFQGQLFDERLLSVTEGLPKGNQIIHFRIQYANGVIKEEDVPVMIIGNVWEFVQVHRVK